MSSKKIPIGKAILFIFLSVIAISGTSVLSLFYYKQIVEKQRHDPDYEIIAIVQTTQNVESLKTVYLAELLDLSVDYPTNLHAFNTTYAEKELLQSPLIKEARVHKIAPASIVINYMVRRPIAYIGDYTNTAIDSDGVIFPFKPFFTPKLLPEIYLGCEFNQDCPLWGSEIKGDRKDLAFKLLEYATIHCCNETTILQRIDVSQAFAPSYGQRQIVLIFEERINKMVDDKSVVYIYPRLLRLTPKSYREQLNNYIILSEHLRQNEIKVTENLPVGHLIKAKELVIDLRLPDIAFIGKS